MNEIAQFLGYVLLFACACGLVAVIVASLMPRKLHECNHCGTLFWTLDKYEFMCPACARAEEIFSADRDWPECDLPEAAHGSSTSTTGGDASSSQEKRAASDFSVSNN